MVQRTNRRPVASIASCRCFSARNAATASLPDPVLAPAVGLTHDPQLVPEEVHPVPPAVGTEHPYADLRRRQARPDEPPARARLVRRLRGRVGPLDGLARDHGSGPPVQLGESDTQHRTRRLDERVVVHRLPQRRAVPDLPSDEQAQCGVQRDQRRGERPAARQVDSGAGQVRRGDPLDGRASRQSYRRLVDPDAVALAVRFAGDDEVYDLELAGRGELQPVDDACDSWAAIAPGGATRSADPIRRMWRDRRSSA